ncbi:MAG: porin [Longimicrobiales bacterium]|nr:porin [Longimicrobiales bacterium]
MRRLFMWVIVLLALLAPGAAQAQISVDGRAASLTLGGRLHTQYQASSVDGAVSDFFIRRARFLVDADFTEFVTARVQSDFAGGGASLLDAYIRLNFDPSFRLYMGQFKRSFDIFYLDSSTDLSIFERDGRIPGLSTCGGVGRICSYGQFTDALDYADRDTGIKIDGTAGTFLYQASLTNGTGVGVSDENDGKSIALRGGVAVTEELVLSGNLGVHDYVVEDDTEQAVAWSADAQWGTWRDGLLVQAALVSGDNWRLLDASDDPRRFLAFQAMGSFYSPLDGDRLEAVEPLFRVSFGDPARALDDDGGTLVTPGIMFYFMGKNKIGANLDYYIPDTGDSEFVFRTGAFLYF